MLAIANTGKIGRSFGKNAGEWTGRVEISKEDIPGSKRSVYGHILGRTFKLCVLTRWDLISASAAPHWLQKVQQLRRHGPEENSMKF